MSNPVCSALNELGKRVPPYHNVSFRIDANGKDWLLYGDNQPLTTWFQCKPTKNGPLCVTASDTKGDVRFYPTPDQVRNGVIFTSMHNKGYVSFGCKP